LLDGKCQDCPIQACESCPVYKEIRYYANMIDGTSRPRRRITSLTAEIYIKLRNEGKSRKEIASQYDLTDKQVKSLTDLWRQRGEFKKDSVSNAPKEVNIPYEKYIEYSQQGLSDMEIAKIYNVTHHTIYGRKRAWKKEGKKFEKRDFLTIEMYLELKEKEMTDHEIARLLNVNPGTIHNYKQKWGLVNGYSKKRFAN
jgi:transposase